jgi:RNA polymerase sigma factor (sigma-70 family)
VDDTNGIAAHVPQLRRYARALTGDYSAAEDLVQDTLERAWKRFGLWRSGSNLRAWLFKIMHNIFLNQVRTAPHTQNQNADHLAPHGWGSRTPEDRLELEDLKKALRRLSNEQREVILLIGLEQLSYDEAAKILGIPIGTVMSRLSRGREQLRTIMNSTSGASQLKVVK